MVLREEMCEIDGVTGGQSSYQGLIPKSNIESAIKSHLFALDSLGLQTLRLDVEEHSGKMTK